MKTIVGWVLFGIVSVDATTCRGIKEIKLRRGDDWSCHAITDFPELQQPRICDENNRFVPGIFTVKNETLGEKDHRLVLTPTFSYDDEGKLKYQFSMDSLGCFGNDVSAIINVVNRDVRTPEHVHREMITFFICFVFLIALFCLGLCCQCDGFFAGLILGDLMFGGKQESKAHFE